VFALAVAAELGTNGHKDSSVLTIGIDTILGFGPPVMDRLNQGPFPQYQPDAAIPAMK